MGLDPDTVGAHFLDSILDACILESGLPSAAAFVSALDARPDLWPLLVRHASVGETWFLRDRAPFLFFADSVRRMWTGSAPLRVLSYPCSSGEEPYSMRIALAESGIPLHACTIDGYDISQPALAKARAGLYSATSFRGCDPALQSNYFTPAADSSWKILPAIAEGVRFEQANFLDPASASLIGLYDIVFCRNLLIYLCPDARLQLLNFLAQRMQPHAVLIVGHAEAGLARQAGFAGTGDPSAFAFVKKLGGETTTPTRPQQNHPQPLGAPGASLLGTWETHTPNRPQLTKPLKLGAPGPGSPRTGLRSWGGDPSHLGTGETTTPNSATFQPTTNAGCPVQAPLGRETTTLSLDAIRTIADNGRIDEAERACIHYLELHPATAECHSLLGSIHSARGNHDLAESSFRKTLYLDPQNTEARLHLTLLSTRKRESRPAHAVAQRRTP